MHNLAYQKGYQDGTTDTWDEAMNGHVDDYANSYADGFHAAIDARTAERQSRPAGDIRVGDGFVAFDDPDDFLNAWFGNA